VKSFFPLRVHPQQKPRSSKFMAVTASPRAVAPKVASSGPPKPTIWQKMMTRKFLVVSVLVHVIFFFSAGYFIVQKQTVGRKKFMPPAGGAEQAKAGAEHKVSLGRKQSTMSAPEQAKRVTTNSALAKVALPEMPELPSATTEVFANRAIGMGGAGSAFGATGTPGGGSGGGGSGINFFGLRTRARNVVICVDVSDSMVDGMSKDGKIKKSERTYAGLEREVSRLIGSLDNSMQFGVVCFAGDVKPYKPSLSPVNDAEKNRAVQFVRELSPATKLMAAKRATEREAAGFKSAAATVSNFNHAGTRAGAALDLAFSMSPDAILFVSDGVPTDKLDKLLLEEIAGKQKGLPKPAIINVVAYLADSGQKFMEELARQNQGSFREIVPGQWSF
jgi:hypothetical protein